MSRITTDQLAELHAQDKSGRITREMFQAFLDSPGKSLKSNPDDSVYRVTIKYTESLEDMILAGHYAHKSDEMGLFTEKNFLLDKNGAHVLAELKLVHLGWIATTKDAVKRIKSLGLVLAKIEHLLAFGATYPQKQREFPVVALGSTLKLSGGSRIPSLDSDWSGRSLKLGWDPIVRGWGVNCRFLVLSK